MFFKKTTHTEFLKADFHSTLTCFSNSGVFWLSFLVAVAGLECHPLSWGRGAAGWGQGVRAGLELSTSCHNRELGTLWQGEWVLGQTFAISWQ